VSTIRQFLSRTKADGVRRSGSVVVTSMGRARTFEAFDQGLDTFIFEKGVTAHLSERPSVLIVEKGVLRPKARGRIMTVSTGNHAVAAFPLLDGRFWNLSALPAASRSETLTHAVVCANVVGDTLEISQREVPTETIVDVDLWLLENVGFSMADVVLSDRNTDTLECYRWLGQEWRIKPLAWTEAEMRVALSASRKRIATTLNYYHSACGVHFLSFAEFARFAGLARSDSDAFLAGLKELVDVYEGNDVSFVRMDKHRGHHEVEFFGISRGVALERLVPELEHLLREIVAGRIGQLGVIQKTQEILTLFRSLLTSPDMADEESKPFVETLYMCITGEVYSIVGEGATPAFDDRRTALPGATFSNGKPTLHPGADARTEILLENLCGRMSKDEIIEYANIYELRAEDESEHVGKGATREVVYKTNMRPLEESLIEKRLSGVTAGYSSYVLARIAALRALGVALSEFYIMLKRRNEGERRMCDHYIRRRCKGEPMEAIPANYFRRTDDPDQEDPEVVLELATQMGDAAAQNMAMKKFDLKTSTPLFGVGKEIYEFDYDVIRERTLPKRVATCSVRGSFGWPILDYTDENFAKVSNFYLGHFAHAVRIFQKCHADVSMDLIAERFMDGFEARTRAMAWQASVMRDRFSDFKPAIPPRFGFEPKWRFVLWSLERQGRDLPELRRLFYEKVRACQVEGKKGGRYDVARGLI